MSQATAGFKAAIADVRAQGFKVVEMPGCWGANNGIAEYLHGIPDGHINHHFGGSDDPDAEEGQANMLVNGYATDNQGGFLPGPVVPSFIGVSGTIYFISDGPANHAGQGGSSVLDRLNQGLAPLGPAANVGVSDDGVKNNRYSGTEHQHPGGSTPYSTALVTSMVAWNAALNIAFGRGANTSIHHYESTPRKPDMSWRGGVNGDGGPHLRALVGAWMKARQAGVKLSPATDPETVLSGGLVKPQPPTPPAPPADWTDTVTEDEFTKLLDARIAAATPAIAAAVWASAIDDPGSKTNPPAKTSMRMLVLSTFKKVKLGI